MATRAELAERDREIKATLDRLRALGLDRARAAALDDLECCVACDVYIVPDDVSMTAWARNRDQVVFGSVCLACARGARPCAGCHQWHLEDATCCELESA